ncbi:hypothetical protein HanPI659440_Chr13g0482411 [Helianthus annuus]|nr:hypothetical protein HanPI659440_Chr13g0482411 [Helianthus annuus]
MFLSGYIQPTAAKKSNNLMGAALWSVFDEIRAPNIVVSSAIKESLLTVYGISEDNLRCYFTSSKEVFLGKILRQQTWDN